MELRSASDREEPGAWGASVEHSRPRLSGRLHEPRGQTPIILVNDSPSTGGFINPYTVPSCAFWKLAQSRPGETYRFAVISVADAQDRAVALDDLCTSTSLEEI